MKYTDPFKQTFPTYGDPADHPNNLANPYGYQVGDEEQGMSYFNAPASNSTMVSDVIVMTERLKKFVPASSVRKGRKPTNNLMLPSDASQENGEGNYKAKFQ